MVFPADFQVFVLIARVYVCMNPFAYTYTCALAISLSHTHTNTHTYTHAHTHLLKLALPRVVSYGVALVSRID